MQEQYEHTKTYIVHIYPPSIIRDFTANTPKNEHILVLNEIFLAFPGADSDALDAVDLLHAKPETPGRSGDAVASPPPFNATIVGDVAAETSGEIRLAATPSATLSVLGSLTLAGGGLSGQGRVAVAGSTLLVSSAAGGDEASSLKNGVVLDMSGGGVWSEGDLHARDGATVVNRGVFEVTAEDGATFGAGGEWGVWLGVSWELGVGSGGWTR